MSKLFEATSIKSLTLANRFIRSATYSGLASEDGFVTPELTLVMVGLAKGQVGLIITGHAYVRPEGQAGPRQLGIYDDALVPGLTEMVEAVHGAGGKIVVQLAHAGLAAPSKLTGQEALGPSAAKGYYPSEPRKLTETQIDELVEAFGQAAGRAKAAGFDGVQVHAAHGYLLSQFLSPAFNQRTDAFGGSVEKRAAFPARVVRAVRQAVGQERPILVK
ncbi:MAG: NADH:flavin oxidoreductase, partial [Deltaproteobacteria bacterium]|nr:NADH:flavin oxidoreductase [Deltaproteobacteria bacterium]